MESAIIVCHESPTIPSGQFRGKEIKIVIHTTFFLSISPVLFQLILLCHLGTHPVLHCNEILHLNIHAGSTRLSRTGLRLSLMGGFVAKCVQFDGV